MPRAKLAALPGPVVLLCLVDGAGLAPAQEQKARRLAKQAKP